VLAALATYRLSVLFTIDEGPGFIFWRWRQWMGAYGPKQTSAAGQLARCPYCVGIYAAVLCTVLALVGHWSTDFVLGVLGLAGAQAALQGRREPE
jgi:hypothetical protein